MRSGIFESKEVFFATKSNTEEQFNRLNKTLVFLMDKNKELESMIFDAVSNISYDDNDSVCEVDNVQTWEAFLCNLYVFTVRMSSLDVLVLGKRRYTNRAPRTSVIVKEGDFRHLMSQYRILCEQTKLLMVKCMRFKATDEEERSVLNTWIDRIAIVVNSFETFEKVIGKCAA